MVAMTKEPRLIRALLRQPVDQTPVWIMRQAGRYLPEYRAVRQQAKTFLTLCKTPELACQVTLQPLERFTLDAAIIFSDILTIPDAFQLGLHFIENEGPCFDHPVTTEADILQLPTIDPEIELRYVMDAIRLVKHELDSRVPLIGFAGSPWTIATYMVEGKSSKNFNQIKKMLYATPQALHKLLLHLSNTIAGYLAAQVKAGADVVMIFDTWGGLLSCPDYVEFSLNYMEKIIKDMQALLPGKKVPVILFTKNSGQYLADMANSSCDAIGLDWTISLRKARELVGHQVALQGNLDPAVLYGTSATIHDRVAALLEDYGTGPGHVFNLGHGIYPDIDPEQVSAMLEAVQSMSRKYHRSEKKYDES